MAHEHAAGKIVALNVWLEVCVDGSGVGRIRSRICIFGLARQKHDANRASNEPQLLFVRRQSHL